MTRGRLLIVGLAVLVIAGAAGAVAGASGRLDLSPDGPAATVTPATVDASATVGYHRCPADDLVLATFHGGDRVYAVGRTEDAAWIAVRAPVDVAASVWVPAGSLAADGDLGALPVTTCAPSGSPSSAPTDQTAGTSTAPPPSTAGGAEPGTTGSTFPSTTGPPTTDSTELPSTTGPVTFPSTTGAPDTAGPTIGPINVQPTTVFEDGPSCVRLARTATVTVTVTDPSGVGRVSLRWSVAEFGDEATMTGTGTYTAVVGPFPVGTVDGAAPVELVVEAFDTAGNRSLAVADGALTLRGCA